jgi:hypothetical protein
MFGKSKPNQQPEDDFESEGAVHDFATDADDEAAADDGESWGEGPESGRDNGQIGSRGRGGSALSKVLPFAAIGFIAAAGAGYYYINYMAAQPATEAPAVTAAEQPTLTDTAPVVQVADNATPTMPTDIAPVEAAPSEASETAVVPLAHMSDEGSPYPAENEAPAPVSNLVAGDPSLAAAPTADVATDTATPPTSVEAVAEPAPVEPAPVETLTAAQVVPPPPVSTTPMSQTSPTPTTSVAAVGVPAVNDDKLADMGQRLDVLEHQIDDLTKAVDRLASSQSSASPALSSTVSSLQAAVNQLQRDVKSAPRTETAATATSAPRPVASTTTTSRPANREATASQTNTSRTSNWVLRAAQDGEAWISPTAQGQLRHVKVGETISGLGRITAIELKNGRWVVSGTQGTVRQ